MNDQDLYFIPINEIARRLDIPAHTLRYWEKQFSGAIRPVTGAGGRRYYRPETVEKLETIKSLLYDRGMTIAGVKRMIHNGEFSKFDTDASFDGIREAPKNLDVAQSQSFINKSEYINIDDIDTAVDLLKQAYDLL